MLRRRAATGKETKQQGRRSSTAGKHRRNGPAGEKARTHRRNPPLQDRIEFKFLSIFRFQDKFIVEFRERDARVAVKFGGVLGEAAEWRRSAFGSRRRHDGGRRITEGEETEARRKDKGNIERGPFHSVEELIELGVPGGRGVFDGNFAGS